MILYIAFMTAYRIYTRLAPFTKWRVWYTWLLTTLYHTRLLVSTHFQVVSAKAACSLEFCSAHKILSLSNKHVLLTQALPMQGMMTIYEYLVLNICCMCCLSQWVFLWQLWKSYLLYIYSTNWYCYHLYATDTASSAKHIPREKTYTFPAGDIKFLEILDSKLLLLLYIAAACWLYIQYSLA